MRLLLDTQLWLWAMTDPGKLSPAARRIFQDESSTLVFSVVTVWEVAIKSALRRPDFATDPVVMLDYLRRGPFEELPVLAEHTLPVTILPPIHKDPFDRILIAQALAEQMTFVTADRKLPAYPGVIQRV